MCFHRETVRIFYLKISLILVLISCTSQHFRRKFRTISYVSERKTYFFGQFYNLGMELRCLTWKKMNQISLIVDWIRVVIFLQIGDEQHVVRKVCKHKANDARKSEACTCIYSHNKVSSLQSTFSSLVTIVSRNSFSNPKRTYKHF